MVDLMVPIMELPKPGDMVRIREEWLQDFLKDHPRWGDVQIVESARRGGDGNLVVKCKGDLHERYLACFTYGGGPW